ncbi:hemagglutinin repeat-containing protein [Herbaspirillum rubrisubalbicans]|uniref:two-partner secretion domain-containing protein n=1 Tax=Herbaspirillum rubrisubalbicans TaxID=80842 RepID=UPI00073A2DEE|nr:hemagglutinin repeat-containing protein [Herbaspirillum rubrisubalbicans]
MSIALALAWHSVVHAQILIDRNAPPTQQASVLSSGNGVPVVNIQQPNARGLSVNRYRRFDVDARGVILNNAGSASKTGLAGYVAGNPRLAGGGARVIVNQINATDPSYLRGFIEVAGHQAQVIIANPAGITCAGCGFINAPRVTLTTGTPIIHQGSLESYRVGGGVLSIEGDGMQAGSADYADLIARAVRINAGLWANRVKVSTGLNAVSADHEQVVPGVAPLDATPLRAIDVAHLGGMYAGHIYLMATEQGVGAHNGGKLVADTELIVTAAGRLENTGTLAARGHTRLEVAGALGNSGSIGGTTGLTVNAAALDNSGDLLTPAALEIGLKQGLINGGRIGSNALLTVQAATLENRQDLYSSRSSVQLKIGERLVNRGNIEARQTVTANATALDNQGRFISEDALAVITRTHIRNTGTLGSQGAVDLRAASVDNQGLISAGKAMTISLSGQLNNDKTLQASGDITIDAAAVDNKGSVVTPGSLAMQIQGNVLNTGKIGAAGAIDFRAAALENRNALYSIRSTIDVQTSGSTLNSGTMEAAQALRLNASALHNSGKLTAVAAMTLALKQQLNNTGEIGANDALGLTASTLDNRGTLRSANAALTLATEGQSTNYGQILAAKNITWTAAGIDNSAGTIVGQDVLLEMRGQRFNNQRGVVVAQQDLRIASGELTNAEGRIAAKGKLNIASGEIDNDQGLLQARKTVEIDTHGQALRNTHSSKDQGLRAGGGLRIESGPFINRSGVVVVVGEANLKVSRLDNQGGDMVTAGALNLDADSLDNSTGKLQAQSTMRIDIAGGTLDNHQGLIRADSDLVIQARTLRNDDTQDKEQGIEGRDVTIRATDVNNNQGAIRTDRLLKIDSVGSVENRRGLLSSKGKVGVSDSTPNRSLIIDNDDGRIVAAEELDLRAAALIGKGLLLSHQDLRIDVVRDLEQRGQTAASANIDIRTAGRFSHYGTTAAGASLSISAKGVENHAGAALLGKEVLLTATEASTLLNRGLIDGVTTRLQAGTLDNLGPGRLYGDRLAIRADVLHNAPEIVEGVLRAPVIAARERLDIGAGEIHNSEQALLYSVGDIAIGGTLGQDYRAGGRARAVNNTSATINADGRLRIAADTINNHNAHFETSEENKPGRRIINYRLVGSSDFISADKARLISIGNSQIIAPENWRAMGDEDNFRLLLPSAEYPFDRYGPPVDYNREVLRRDYSSGGIGVVPAYLKPLPESSTETAILPALPELFVYLPSDRIWDVFGIARPTAEVPREPDKPAGCSDADNCVSGDYQQRRAAWKAVRDAQLPAYEKLNEAIRDFNISLRERLFDQWIIHDGTEQIRRTIVTRSAPGMITSGGGMDLVAGVVNNYASQFIAGGALVADRINGTTINNIGPLGRQTVTSTGTAQRTFVKSHSFKADDRRYESAPYASQTIETQFQLEVTPTHGTGSTRDAISRAAITAPTQPLPATGRTNDLRAPAVDVSLPINALYQVNNSSPTAPLVQTDARFIGNRNWLSSDFLIQRIREQSGPAPQVQRFADGFYEQQLIQRQIQEATGQRYLKGFNSNEAQYLALMQAGLQQAQAQRYALGIALSEAQIAQLKTDIVWLVKQTVTLADGRTQEVLVPQVYLHPSNIQVSGQQTLIAGNDLALQTAQDILNRGGTIAARSGVSLRADNLRNLGGRIVGGNVDIAAASDIDNAGGSIDADQQLILRAGRDIALTSTSVDTANATTVGRNINQVASVSGKDVVIAAGRDFTANAAVIAARGDVSILAARDVNFGAVTEYFRQEIRWANDRGGSNWVRTLTGPNLVDRGNGAYGTTEVGVNRAVVTGSQEVATQVSGSNIRIQAGQDVITQGTQIVADGALQAQAGRDIQIGTANASGSARDQVQRSSGGILSAKTVRTDDASSFSRQMGSTLSGNAVLVRAGQDVKVTGSDVVSTQGTAVVAGRDVNIASAIDSSTRRSFRQERASGVMGAGLGVTVGSRVQSRDVDGHAQTAAASTVGSVEGNVTIVAGNRYTQVGSDVLAPKGDIDIAARSVEIRAAEQASRTETEDKFKQSGLTVAVTSPVLSAIQTVGQMAEAASKTKDRRMQALAGATAGLSVSNAIDAVIAGQGQTIDGKANQIVTGPADPVTGKAPTRDANAAEKVGGINLAFSLGASSSQSRSEQTSNTVRGSTVSAGGSVNISAQGGGADSNIVIQGSDIKAGVNATLKAANEVRLISAQETSEQHSRNSGASGSVGVSIGTDGLLFTASASGSRGKGEGAEVTQVNTHVDAGNKPTIVSGTDTTISGAVVRGKQVEMEVGTSGKGNLNIASQQDSSTFQSRQQSLGGSVSVGTGKMGGSVNYSQSNINSNYASVMEQSGIKAGDGGFQINVRGNTDLKGAVIASSDKAVAANKNSLTTQTLTQSDIQNIAQYDAQSVGIGVGYNTGKDGGLSATPPMVVGANGSASSTTRSAISGGVITITDDKKQQELTGKTAEQAIASVNREVSSSKEGSNALKPIFNKEEIENKTAIAGAFTRELGSFLNNRAKEADEARRKLDDAIAEERGNPVEQRDETRLRRLTEQYLDAEKWSSAGTYRQYATAIVGAVTGNLNASTSQFIQAAAVNYLQGLGAEQVKRIADSLESEPARVALQGVLGCAGALAKDAACGAGVLGASAGTVINALLQAAESPGHQEKESRKNLVTSIVAGIATAAGNKDSPTATLAAQLEAENNALGMSYSKQFLNKIRACDASQGTCFAELKEEAAKQRKLFTEQLEKGCNGAAATSYACETVMSSGQAALNDLAHALYFAKSGDQKAYVKVLIAEQTLDMDRQYPNLVALGERASFLDQLALQLQQMWVDVGPAGASAGLIGSGQSAIVNINKVRSNEVKSDPHNSERKRPEPYFKDTQEAAAAAHELGFVKINETVNKQAVFRKGKLYITRDADGHNGGAWKMATSVKNLQSKQTRLGTYDSKLNKIGD